MRSIWSLPRAAPALLRHLGAYVELIGLELHRAQQDLIGEMVAGAALAVSVLFALLFGCLLIVAYYWDTPYRIASIACLAGAFVLIAIVAAIYRSGKVRARSPFLATTKREWQHDRAFLEHLLSNDEE